MTPLTESRLRGLAEKLGWETWNTIVEGIPMMCLRSKHQAVIATEKLDWVETPPGAFYILEWMQDNDRKKNHYFFVTINSAVGGWSVEFINNVDDREGSAREEKLEHAIAHAAADALEVPP